MSKSNNIIEFKARAGKPVELSADHGNSGTGKPINKSGKWVPYDGRVSRVWRCECGSTLMQIVEDIGTQCVVCEKTIMKL